MSHNYLFLTFYDYGFNSVKVIGIVYAEFHRIIVFFHCVFLFVDAYAHYTHQSVFRKLISNNF